MKNKILIILTILLLPIITFSNNIPNNSPYAVLEKSVMSIQNDLISNPSYYQSNPANITSLLNKKLIPNLDINYIAKNVLGKIWISASESKKQIFLNDFLKMVVFLYGKNISIAGEYELKIRPIRSAVYENSSYVQITGILIRQGKKQGSNITFYMKKQYNKWKIYDVAFEGISIINNYRQQFQSINNINDAITAVKKVSDKIKAQEN